MDEKRVVELFIRDGRLVVRWPDGRRNVVPNGCTVEVAGDVLVTRDEQLDLFVG